MSNKFTSHSNLATLTRLTDSAIYGYNNSSQRIATLLCVVLKYTGLVRVSDTYLTLDMKELAYRLRVAYKQARYVERNFIKID